jgi:hypothetical protein
MTQSSLRVFAVVSFALASAACSAAPGQPVGQTSSAISGATVVSRAMEWVNADLHYCQAAYGAVDYDSSCWAWEGSSHVCDRESNSAWNAYRSDCSGFVTWAWGLPPVGDGGYVTGDFAPYDNAFSTTIDGSDLQPGDALNKTPDEHIVLFKQWVTPGQSAVFMEEPGCSASPPYAHEFTSNVSISGTEVYIDYEGATFYAIRYTGSSGGSSPPPSSGSGCTLAGHSYDQNTCTETLQCDNGQWVARTSDPSSCNSGVEANGGCITDSGSVAAQNTCTSTLQCDDGVWVDRSDDPTACNGSSSSISSSCTLAGHTYGQNTCTETLQCDNGQWVARTGDPSNCDSGVEPSGECITDSGSVVAQNTCTSTQQCDDGVWVDRTDDPTSCL